MERTSDLAVIIGSSPAAPSFPLTAAEDAQLIAINNAWRLPYPFKYLVYPNDFPKERLPPDSFPGKLISNEKYMPPVDIAGGITFCGATMAFAAGYWAVGALRPRVLGFFACDMIYTEKSGASHFYGNGTPDPLRHDISLRSLEARSARLFAWGMLNNILIVNHSIEANSRLIFPRLTVANATSLLFSGHVDLASRWSDLLEQAKIIREKEAEVPFEGLRHDYWRLAKDDAAVCAIMELDRMWLETIPSINEGWRAVSTDCDLER